MAAGGTRLGDTDGSSDGGGTVAVVGCGVTGKVAVESLAASGRVVRVLDPRPAASATVARLANVEPFAGQLGGIADIAEALRGCALAVLCQPGDHAELIRQASRADGPRLFVTLTDQLAAVDALLDLDGTVRAAGRTVIVGAGMAPGLTSLLARALTDVVAVPEEIHVAIHGTGGPACARQHHRSLARPAMNWHDGQWLERIGGSGRELCWFPEPIGAHDCYRAELADPRLLHHAFPGLLRISARVSATRRDRLTARLPMLTPPHTGGNVGAVRVEVRGAGPDGERVTVIAGASGRVADIAGRVAACTALHADHGGGYPPGVYSLADRAVAGAEVLADVQHAGVTIQAFTGVPRADEGSVPSAP